MRNNSFFIGINGLRAIAILSVAILHFSTAFLDYNLTFDRSFIDSDSLLRQIHRAGMDGVYLFFGISGFLITHYLTKSHFSLKFSWEFIKKRVSRIYPPFIGSIFILMFVQLYFSDYSMSDLMKSAAVSTVFMHDLFFKSYSYINPVTWSLEVEVQFYIFASIFVPLFISNKKFLISFFIVVIAGWALLELSVRENYGSRFFSDYILYFFSGVLANVFYKDLEGWFVSSSIAFDIAFVIALVFFFYVDVKLLQSLTLFALILLSFKIKWLNELFASRIISYVSKVSYTYYLFHYAIFHMFMKLFSNAITNSGGFEISVTIGMLIFIPLSFFMIYPFYFLLERNHEKREGYFEYLGNLQLQMLGKKDAR
ncbi:acyltransferase family protein [Vibrio alfacsensis]|uniref:acyltransferase family protein n=1 Tax=Vibrio alfacsensis TaxID=1074311 RepID=UPI001BF0B851|nr:acyltransferase [Vibrio alfacsensis]BCN23023.1 hypothetical protein VYA_02150 [Vibrio alfacsensis]